MGGQTDGHTDGQDDSTVTLRKNPFSVYHDTESCFRHPRFDLRGTRKVEIRHTNFHFSSKRKKKSRKYEKSKLANQNFHFSTYRLLSRLKSGWQKQDSVL